MPFLACLWLALIPADPPLSDLQRFPRRELVEAAVSLAHAHKEWVESKVAAFGDGRAAWDMGEWAQDAAECWYCWYLLDRAQLPGGSEHWRREKLAELRRWLSDEAYYAGRMPPPVPLWRFWRAD